MAASCMQGVAIGGLNEDCQPEPVHADAKEQVAALIYTTGTTGQPKGVMLTHRNLLFIAATSSQVRGLQANDRTYCVLPITHVFGLASVALATLYAGAALYLRSAERRVGKECVGTCRSCGAA